jgi:hypothetical protein
MRLILDNQFFEEHDEKMNRLRLETKTEFKDIFPDLLAHYFRVDPMNINFGDNDDEYDLELTTILPRLHTCKNLNAVKHVIQEEFESWFCSMSIEKWKHEELSRLTWEACLIHRENLGGNKQT